MAKRKLLKNIGNGIISSFISRNNDIDGYWAIGKLYCFISILEVDAIEINLIDPKVSVLPERFQGMSLKYSTYLYNQLKAQKIDASYVCKAKIVIVSYPDSPSIELWRNAPHKLNCKMIITDDLGKEYIVEKNVWCRAHNPNREMKSTRA